jgi:prepilin-type N-terminal cleavage/methylation domain-containing protein
MSDEEHHLQGCTPRVHVVRGFVHARTRGPGHGPRGRAADRPSGRWTAGVAGRSPGEEGFTLVELLVVVLVLATLVGIAVPTFVQQREGAWGAAVSAELRAAVIALESSRAQNGTYDAAVLAAGQGWGYEPSSSVTLRHDIVADDYCMIAWFEADGTGTTAALTSSAPPPSSVQLWGATPAGVREVEAATFCD